MTDDLSNDINTTGLISVGETINGTIKNYSDSDWIKVSLEAGKEYVFKQTNNTGYVQISSLYDHNGSFVTNFKSSSSTYIPEEKGIYFVAIGRRSSSWFWSTEFEYTLSLSIDDHLSNSSTSSEIFINSEASGKINSSNDQDWFFVTLTKGIDYLITSKRKLEYNGAKQSPDIKIYNSSEDVVSSKEANYNYDTSLLFTPELTARQILFTYPIATPAVAPSAPVVIHVFPEKPNLSPVDIAS